MKLIVGLGNPGTKYTNTRHNVGFKALDHLEIDFKLNKKFSSLIYVDKKSGVIFAQPQTFMNESGLAVSKIARYYKIKSPDIIIVYDDKDLPFGKIRIRPDGSAGGHNGVKSIIQYLGTPEFIRLRIGIKNSYAVKDTAKYVLSKFTQKENSKLENIFIVTTEAIEALIFDDVNKAMNHFN